MWWWRRRRRRRRRRRSRSRRRSRRCLTCITIMEVSAGGVSDVGVRLGDCHAAVDVLETQSGRADERVNGWQLADAWVVCDV